jgi:hypothetical protein
MIFDNCNKDNWLNCNSDNLTNIGITGFKYQIAVYNIMVILFFNN